MTAEASVSVTVVPLIETLVVATSPPATTAANSPVPGVDVLAATSKACEAELPLVRKDRTGVDVRLRVVGIVAAGESAGAIATLDPVAPEQLDWPGRHASITPRQRQVL